MAPPTGRQAQGIPRSLKNEAVVSHPMGLHSELPSEPEQPAAHHGQIGVGVPDPFGVVVYSRQTDRRLAICSHSVSPVGSLRR